MTRVSSFGHNQSMVSQLLTNQSRLFDTQEQINTGKKSSTFSGYAREAQTLLGSKSLLSRNNGYTANLTDVQQKLEMNDLYLESTYKAADNLRQAITNALGTGSSVAFVEELKQAASIILSGLNAQMDGRYLFAGSRTDTKPVAANTLDDLKAAPDIASLLKNDSVNLSSRVGDNMDLEYGVLASDVGQGLLETIKAIADFDAGPLGPLSGNLTTAQRTFLEGQLGALNTSISTVQTEIAANGSRQGRVDILKDNLGVTKDFLTNFIADIEEVNMTEAVSRFNADQLALETSYKIVGQLSKLSLVNYL
ncbi:flagellin [Govanella unica]|uniref:Flagellin n=1 Tax=Govanella unica TaxID=2975056 RepID=A0A9X3Z6F5_9PROT|nr:flagellin [Govania unica]MDA5193022.1 flagellin [Govania unica]